MRPTAVINPAALTVPLLYVKGEVAGGCDIIREMGEARDLPQMFDAKGVSYDKSRRIA